MDGWVEWKTSLMECSERLPLSQRCKGKYPHTQAKNVGTHSQGNIAACPPPIPFPYTKSTYSDTPPDLWMALTPLDQVSCEWTKTVCRVGKEVPDTWKKACPGMDNPLESWDQGEWTRVLLHSKCCCKHCVYKLTGSLQRPWGSYYFFLPCMTN